MAIRSEEGIYDALSFCAVGDGYVFDTESGKVIARCIENENPPDSLAAYKAYEGGGSDDMWTRPENFFDWFREQYDDEPGDVIYHVTYHDPDVDVPEDHDPEGDPYGEFDVREEEMTVDELASLLSGMRDVAGYEMSADDLANESFY